MIEYLRHELMQLLLILVMTRVSVFLMKPLVHNVFTKNILRALRVSLKCLSLTFSIATKTTGFAYSQIMKLVKAHRENSSIGLTNDSVVDLQQYRSTRTKAK